MSKGRILAASFSCLIIIAPLSLTTLAQAPAGSPQVQVDQQGQRRLDFKVTPPLRYEAMNPNEERGDKLSQPRLIAAALVAQATPNPHFIADLGSYTGEFLEAFMERFPNARGQWTEPVTTNEENAKTRLARFGDRVSYVIGCPARDLSLGCVPKDADVIITSWVSIHQPLAGIAKVYEVAYNQLPSGGWLVNLDHVTLADSQWQGWEQEARKEFHAKQEGPPVHLKTPFPTLDEQIAAFKVAGFEDVHVVWTSFTDVLFMARKP